MSQNSASISDQAFEAEQRLLLGRMNAHERQVYNEFQNRLQISSSKQSLGSMTDNSASGIKRQNFFAQQQLEGRDNLNSYSNQLASVGTMIRMSAQGKPQQWESESQDMVIGVGQSNTRYEIGRKRAEEEDFQDKPRDLLAPASGPQEGLEEYKDPASVEGGVTSSDQMPAHKRLVAHVLTPHVDTDGASSEFTQSDYLHGSSRVRKEVLEQVRSQGVSLEPPKLAEAVSIKAPQESDTMSGQFVSNFGKRFSSQYRSSDKEEVKRNNFMNDEADEPFHRGYDLASKGDTQEDISRVLDLYKQDLNRVEAAQNSEPDLKLGTQTNQNEETPGTFYPRPEAQENNQPSLNPIPLLAEEMKPSKVAASRYEELKDIHAMREMTSLEVEQRVGSMRDRYNQIIQGKPYFSKEEEPKQQPSIATSCEYSPLKKDPSAMGRPIGKPLYDEYQRTEAMREPPRDPHREPAKELSSLYQPPDPKQYDLKPSQEPQAQLFSKPQASWSRENTFAPPALDYRQPASEVREEHFERAAKPEPPASVHSDYQKLFPMSEPLPKPESSAIKVQQYIREQKEIERKKELEQTWQSTAHKDIDLSREVNSLNFKQDQDVRDELSPDLQREAHRVQYYEEGNQSVYSGLNDSQIPSSNLQKILNPIVLDMADQQQQPKPEHRPVKSIIKEESQDQLSMSFSHHRRNSSIARETNTTQELSPMTQPRPPPELHREEGSLLKVITDKSEERKLDFSEFEERERRNQELIKRLQEEEGRSRQHTTEYSDILEKHKQKFVKNDQPEQLHYEPLSDYGRRYAQEAPAAHAEVPPLPVAAERAREVSPVDELRARLKHEEEQIQGKIDNLKQIISHREKVEEEANLEIRGTGGIFSKQPSISTPKRLDSAHNINTLSMGYQPLSEDPAMTTGVFSKQRVSIKEEEPALPAKKVVNVETRKVRLLPDDVGAPHSARDNSDLEAKFNCKVNKKKAQRAMKAISAKVAPPLRKPSESAAAGSQQRSRLSSKRRSSQLDSSHQNSVKAAPKGKPEQAASLKQKVTKKLNSRQQSKQSRNSEFARGPASRPTTGKATTLSRKNSMGLPPKRVVPASQQQSIHSNFERFKENCSRASMDKKKEEKAVRPQPPKPPVSRAKAVKRTAPLAREATAAVLPKAAKADPKRARNTSVNALDIIRKAESREKQNASFSKASEKNEVSFNQGNTSSLFKVDTQTTEKADSNIGEGLKPLSSHRSDIRPRVEENKQPVPKMKLNETSITFSDASLRRLQQAGKNAIFKTNDFTKGQPIDLVIPQARQAEPQMDSRSSHRYRKRSASKGSDGRASAELRKIMKERQQVLEDLSQISQHSNTSLSRKQKRHMKQLSRDDQSQYSSNNFDNLENSRHSFQPIRSRGHSVGRGNSVGRQSHSKAMPPYRIHAKLLPQEELKRPVRSSVDLALARKQQSTEKHDRLKSNYSNPDLMSSRSGGRLSNWKGHNQDVPPPKNFIALNKKGIKKLQFQKQKEKIMKGSKSQVSSREHRESLRDAHRDAHREAKDSLPRDRNLPSARRPPPDELEEKFETMEKIQANLVKKMNNLMSFIESHCDDCPSFKSKLHGLQD